MDASLIAIAVLVGALILAGGALAYRASDRAMHPPPPPPLETGLDEGIGQVLSVLRSMAVVVDESDAVIKASPAATAFGIVRAQRLVVADLIDLVAAVRRDGRIRQVDLELPRGPVGGGTLAVSVRIAPLGLRYVLVLIEDHTDAVRVDAVRRDFVANVSHELKTPVGALRLLAEAVQDASDDPEAVVRFAGRMQHESLRLQHLIQELIDLSRLESRDPLKEAQPIGVDDIVAAAVDRTRESASAKGIEVCGGGEGGLKVFGSEAQLTMALSNLIENAVNYSAGKTRVAVAVRRTDDLAEIAVTDQGIGIPGTELQRIFERFYRVDPARSRVTGGTGLGLSIVKHIAQNHGGDVRVWSAEGSGSTFTLRLPLLSPASGGARRLSEEEYE